jgi:general L-amino acid transport system permease protein
MEGGAADAGVRTDKTSWWYDPRIRGFVMQFVMVVFVVGIFGTAIYTANSNLDNHHNARGFGFLSNNAGFDLTQSLIDYPKNASYGRALLVGFLNTALVAVVGIICATILGFLAGIGRLSKNFVIASISTLYVETIRNVPLLLQMLFWYVGVLQVLPAPRNSFQPVPGSVFLNNRGLFIPEVVFGHTTGWAIAASLLIGLIAAFFISKWATARQMRTGQQFPSFWTGLALVIGLPLIAFIVTGADYTTNFPIKSTFNLSGGVRIIPEFMALVLALTIYTGVFIAEIVRSGIMAVNRGQSEACHALGLTNAQGLRLVVIPQAMRVIIPPLTNQFLNLTKNSSLAVAIGYPDLVYVGGTVLNQSGQAIEVISIWMLVYLGTSVVTATLMNWYNARNAIVER